MQASQQRPVEPAAPWAASWRTVGVTGTNGKTSTTALLSAAIRAAGLGVFTVSTLDFEIDGRRVDAPRTWPAFLETGARAARGGCRHAVVEITSQALARGYARRWRYDLGVFTNLSEDHIQAHGGLEDYLAAKAQLFLNLTPGGAAILNAHDPAALLIERVLPDDLEVIWFGAPSRGPRLRLGGRYLGARAIEVSAAGTRVELEGGELATRLGPGPLEIPLIGDIFAENALAAACAGLALGLEADAIRRGLASCPVVPGRFELVRARPAVVIDYAHTADALARVCEVARALVARAGGRVIVVFGAGGGADAGKRGPMGEVVGARADRAIVTSDNPRDEEPAVIAEAVAAGCRAGGRAAVTVELDRAAAIRQAITSATPRDVVLIAGKGHETGQLARGVTTPFSDHEVARGAG